VLLLFALLRMLAQLQKAVRALSGSPLAPTSPDAALSAPASDPSPSWLRIAGALLLTSAAVAAFFWLRPDHVTVKANPGWVEDLVVDQNFVGVLRAASAAAALYLVVSVSWLAMNGRFLTRFGGAAVADPVRQARNTAEEVRALTSTNEAQIENRIDEYQNLLKRYERSQEAGRKARAQARKADQQLQELTAKLAQLQQGQTGGPPSPEQDRGA
jgi:hypothetical protein